MREYAKYMVNLEESGLDLLYKLLTYDPTQRISAIQALKHEYFKDFEKWTLMSFKFRIKKLTLNNIW